MRLAVMFNNQPAKLLMQITRGSSEIAARRSRPTARGCTSAASAARAAPTGTGASGVIYEMTIPPRFRAIQKADAFSFRERLTVAPAVTVTSEPVTIDRLPRAAAREHQRRQRRRVQHRRRRLDQRARRRSRPARRCACATPAPPTSARRWRPRSPSACPTAPAATDGVFRTVTSEPDTIPDAFDFGTIRGRARQHLIESDGRGARPASTCRCRSSAARTPSTASTAAPGPTPTAALKPEQTLQMRHVSNPPDQSVRTTHLRLGRT